MKIENSWNIFFAIYIVLIVIVGIAFFYLIQKRKARMKKAAHYQAPATSKGSGQTAAKTKRPAHSERYLSYYNNIGTMSFQELDRMCGALGEYYDDVSELEGLIGLMRKNQGKTMNNDDRAKIAECRNQPIPNCPYGCRTYGEACDLVNKAYDDKEYWNYINK